MQIKSAGAWKPYESRNVAADLWKRIRTFCIAPVAQIWQVSTQHQESVSSPLGILASLSCHGCFLRCNPAAWIPPLETLIVGFSEQNQRSWTILMMMECFSHDECSSIQKHHEDVLKRVENMIIHQTELFVWTDTSRPHPVQILKSQCIPEKYDNLW